MKRYLMMVIDDRVFSDPVQRGYDKMGWVFRVFIGRRTLAQRQGRLSGRKFSEVAH